MRSTAGASASSRASRCRAYRRAYLGAFLGNRGEISCAALRNSQPLAGLDLDACRAQVGDEPRDDREHEVGRVGIVEVERVVGVEEADEVAPALGPVLKDALQPPQLGRLATATQAGDEAVAVAIRRQPNAVGELLLDVREADLLLPVDVCLIVCVERNRRIKTRIQAGKVDHISEPTGRPRRARGLRPGARR